MDDSDLLNTFARRELLQHAPCTPPSNTIINSESVATFRVYEDAARASPLALHFDRDPPSQDTSASRPMVNPLYTVPRRYRGLHAISNMVAHAWKKDTNPSSSTPVQGRETKLDGHRLTISVNRLAKSILIYIRSPIWKCIGITILPMMEEYSHAWVNLLQALISHIKISRRYTCFLTLMPKAVAQDLKSILNKFRKDLADSEKFNLQSSWRRLWRSPEWKFSEIERGPDDRAFKRLYDASIDIERTLFIGLSNIQYFAALLSSRPDAIGRSNGNSRVDLPLSLQVEKVKDTLYAMNAARHILGRNLEMASLLTSSLVSSQESSASSSDSSGSSLQASAASSNSLASRGRVWLP